MYISTFYLRTQCFAENRHFFVPCVKRQMMFQEMSYINTEFFVVYTGCTRGGFFLKQLCEHLGCEDIHVTFCFGYFFTSSNLYKIHCK
jgi:hypothetical protein